MVDLLVDPAAFMFGRFQAAMQSGGFQKWTAMPLKHAQGNYVALIKQLHKHGTSKAGTYYAGISMRNCLLLCYSYPNPSRCTSRLF